MTKTINPELIEGLNEINNAMFNFLVKADKELEKGINKAKGLDLLAGEKILKEGTYGKLQKTRKELFDYLTDLSSEAEKRLSSYKKQK